jgi:phospholipid transport system substrate-binding protein
MLKHRLLVALTAALALLGMARAASTAATDPAAARIEALDHGLLESMKAGATMSARARYKTLTPLIEASFDLPLMTRFAVGPAWTGMTESEHEALVSAFTRLSAASYAHNFNRFGGERFDIDATVETRGGDKIIQSHLIAPHGAPVALTYRMRQTPAGWKIVDVYYGAISQLTTRRSDFAAPLAAGGAKGLVAHLDALTDTLLK